MFWFQEGGFKIKRSPTGLHLSVAALRALYFTAHIFGANSLSCGGTKALLVSVSLEHHNNASVGWVLSREKPDLALALLTKV